MDCINIPENISKYIDNMLSVEESKKIESHMESCTDCKRFYNAMCLTNNYISKEIKVDEFFYTKVVDKLDPQMYRRNKTTFIAFRIINKLTPVLKPASVLLAVFLCTILVFQYGGYITGPKTRIEGGDQIVVTPIDLIYPLPIPLMFELPLGWKKVDLGYVINIFDEAGNEVGAIEEKYGLPNDSEILSEETFVSSFSGKHTIYTVRVNSPAYSDTQESCIEYHVFLPSGGYNFKYDLWLKDSDKAQMKEVLKNILQELLYAS
ncbi:anti-sigma factor family protein [Acetivibrio cellulolyticus]|uniref:anti-sigma factor family protein n=1 Tax=Acetivibrio cellulolyticus TaxID=35830 RepID=UPI0001E2D0DC|nr:zf-HC2 domain-containing protein [Acetivibrio cellulolyticus]